MIIKIPQGGSATSDWGGIQKSWLLEREENRSTQRKQKTQSKRSKDGNQSKTHAIYGAALGNSTGPHWRESSALTGLTVRGWHVFFNVCLHSRSFPLRADWRKSDGPTDREPQGNWRWNWNARDGVASSPFFSRPAARASWRTCSQVTVPLFVFSVLLIPPFNVLSCYFYVSLNLVAGPTVGILIKFVTQLLWGQTRILSIPKVMRCFEEYSPLSLNGHLYKTDTSVKRTP